METLNLNVYHSKRLQLKNIKKIVEKNYICFVYYEKQLSKAKKNNDDELFIIDFTKKMDEAYADFIDMQNIHLIKEKEFKQIEEEYLKNVKNGKYIFDVTYDYDNVCEDYYLNQDKEKYFHAYNIFKYHSSDYNYQFDSYDNDLDINTLKYQHVLSMKKQLKKQLQKQLERDYIYFLHNQINILKIQKSDISNHYNEMDEAYADFIDTRNKYLRILKELKKI